MRALHRWIGAALVLVVAAACSGASEKAARPTTFPAIGTPPRAPSAKPPPLPVAPPYREYRVPAGDHPHDVAPAADGGVWFTAQRTGALGHLDPRTGKVRRVSLGRGSAPHGVIVGPDRAAWVTDGGRNAIVRVDPRTLRVGRFPLPIKENSNLNTAAFDGNGTLWFTGQAGYYGSVDPATAKVAVRDAPEGSGPYGIAATPEGVVWFSSLAGSYIARIDSATGSAQKVDVPTAGGGARRIWSDSRGRLWVTEWFAGKLARYDPASKRWSEWRLPGSSPQPYAVFVDGDDIVWVTDFASNSLVRFDSKSERFIPYRFPSAGAEVRQLLGRPGEVWGAESGTDKIVVLRTD
jgi:virginiamycin B lyase